MELKEILSIAGAPGLYKYVAQGKGGIIVESLADARRTMVSGSSKVSALGDIAIFTDADEVALAEVFQTIYDKNKSVLTLTNKSSNDELHAFMAEILPSYDRERVHTSDLKKMVTWFNILVGAGMTNFKVEESEQQEQEGGAIPAKQPKADGLAEATAKKQAAINAKPKATAPKTSVTSSKTTTNRKSQ